jgi:hypothetical protein
MTWISDVPEFALAVAEAGGLPTVALGLRDRRQLETDFSRLRSLMGSRPYAVNLIALAENPYLEAQLAWVEAVRPPFVAIAAGDPAYAIRLREKGIEVIIDRRRTAALAWKAGWPGWSGGREAGGHVGAPPPVVSDGLELKRRGPLARARTWCWQNFRETALRKPHDADGQMVQNLPGHEIVSTGTDRLSQQVILGAAPGAACREISTLRCAPQNSQDGGHSGPGEKVCFRQRK